MNNNAQIGKRIRDIRKQKGLTQAELAERTGYTNKSSIGKVETGHVDLSQSKIKAFARALDVSISAIIGEAVVQLDIPQTPTTPYDLTPTEAGVLSTFRLLSSTQQQTVMQFLLMLTGPNGDRITEDRLRKL